MKNVLIATAIAIVMVGTTRVASAQYMYLDSDGDGVHTSADVMSPAGTPATVRVYLDTSKNRDNSPAVCNTADGPLNLRSYAFNLQASSSVQYEGFTNSVPGMALRVPPTPDPTYFTVGYGGGIPRAPGLYLLGTLTVTAQAGTPSLEIVDANPANGLDPGRFTAFGTTCSGNGFDGIYKLDGLNTQQYQGNGDWFDVDGLAPAGGVGGGQSPILDPISDRTVDEGSLLALDVTASDPENDPLTFLLPGGQPGASITPGGHFTWTPDESQGGLGISYNFLVQVTDGASSDFRSFAVWVNEVNQDPVIAPIDDQTVNQGATLSLSPIGYDADIPGQALSWALFAGPLGASVDPLNGQFTWTPGTAGDFPIAIGLGDGAGGFVVEDFVIHVPNANRAPDLDPVGDRTTDEGLLLAFTATASDPDLPPQALTFSLAPGAPSGAAISPGGDFAWTPTEAQGPGAYAMTVQVSDGALTDAETFHVTVQEVNRAPQIEPLPNRTVDEGPGLVFMASATDGDLPANALTWSLAPGAPAGATINPTSGILTYIPSELEGGTTVPVTVVVTDNGTPPLQGSATFSYTILESNLPPVVPLFSGISVQEGELVSFVVGATDNDVPAQTLTYSLGVGAPPDASISPDGTFTWTPGELYGGPQGGMQHLVPIVVSDGVVSVTRNLSVIVSEVNEAPVIDPIPEQTVDEGGIVSFTATATDADIPANTLTFTLGASPGSITPDGQFTWSVPEELAAPEVQLQIVVTDDGFHPMQDVQNIRVVIHEVNQAPVLQPIGDRTVAKGETVTFTAVATDADQTDSGLQQLTFSLDPGAPPAASITANGAFTWAGGNPGIYPVTIRVTDDGVPPLDDFETIQITVANDAPVLDSIGDQTISEENLLTFTATATDADAGDALTFSLGGGAPLGAAITAEGEFTWTPAENQGPAVHAVTVRVSDGFASDLETIQVTVLEFNRAPVWTQPLSMAVLEGATATQQLVATDADIPAQTLTYSKLSAPFFVTVSPAGLVTVSPGFSDAGMYLATVRVSDGVAIRNATFQITVTNLNHAPIAEAGGPYSGNTTTPVAFNGTASSDPDGDALTYSWNFGDGVNGSGGTPSHQYAAAGTYSVTLTVSDGVASAQDGATASIASGTVPALVFFDRDSKINLKAGKPSYCVQVQPVGNSFSLTNVNLATIVMISAGTGSVSQITALGGKSTVLDGDMNSDGVQEIKACFAKGDLRNLFSNLGSGSTTVTVAVEGNLYTGGKFHGEVSAVVSGVTGGALAASITPNPLNPKATLTLSLAKPGPVRVQLFDIHGRLMRTLQDGAEPAGYVDVEIDGFDAAGRKLASGVYYVNIVTAEGRITKPITILK